MRVIFVEKGFAGVKYSHLEIDAQNGEDEELLDKFYTEFMNKVRKKDNEEMVRYGMERN